MSPPPAKRIEACRSCGGTDLTDLFSLGSQHVSDFVDANDVCSGEPVPIELVMCAACTLVQQRWTAPQDFLYTRHYWYRSGTTATMREALRDVAEAAAVEAKLVGGDWVLDIGANDGTLLRSYPRNLNTIGVEPANNFEWPDGVTCWEHAFWPCNIKDITHFKPRAITACGMFYDLDDPNPFVRGVAEALHPDGVFIAQLMCLAQTVRMADVGNFCHEHLEFYSLDSLLGLFGRHGLMVYKMEENAVNGGSYRLYCCHIGARPLHPSVTKFMRVEHHALLSDPETFRLLLKRMEENRDACVEFISGVAGGRLVWGYGASTKGNVILQWYGLDGTEVTAICDKSPEKWGKVTKGTSIPIRSPEEFRAANPDYALALPYAFIDEFMGVEHEWLEAGGKFLVPLPHFKVVQSA